MVCLAHRAIHKKYYDPVDGGAVPKPNHFPEVKHSIFYSGTAPFIVRPHLLEQIPLKNCKD